MGFLIFPKTTVFRWVHGSRVALLGVWAILSVVPLPAWAGKAKGLTITSNSMELDEKSKIAVFSGNVLAKDGHMSLSADRMSVYYSGKSTPNSKNRGVREVRAEGHVSIIQAENHGEAEYAVYNVSKRTLEMVGEKNNAAIRRGSDHLEGKEILLTLGEDKKIDRVSVKGEGKQRVSARITPSGGVESRNKGIAATLPELVDMNIGRTREKSAEEDKNGPAEMPSPVAVPLPDNQENPQASEDMAPPTLPPRLRGDRVR